MGRTCPSGWMVDLGRKNKGPLSFWWSWAFILALFVGWYWLTHDLDGVAVYKRIWYGRLCIWRCSWGLLECDWIEDEVLIRLHLGWLPVSGTNLGRVQCAQSSRGLSKDVSFSPSLSDYGHACLEWLSSDRNPLHSELCQPFLPDARYLNPRDCMQAIGKTNIMRPRLLYLVSFNFLGTRNRIFWTLYSLHFPVCITPSGCLLRWLYPWTSIRPYLGCDSKALVNMFVHKYHTFQQNHPFNVLFVIWRFINTGQMLGDALHPSLLPPHGSGSEVHKIKIKPCNKSNAL